MAAEVAPTPRGPTPALSVAPMMDTTDRHLRVLLRQLTRRTLLYTEMIPTGAILHGDRERALGFSPVERPLALQLGGDDPAALAECARIAEAWGYDEVNLNVGCPSPRVKEGSFGACLMERPERVAEGVAAMRAATRLQITVKHRIGVDERDRYEDMLRFVDAVAAAGCDRFTVHARKAWLEGLSPKQNRTVPPLRYEDVYRLKRERPALAVELNGGVRTLEQALAHLEQVDAVMIGRAAADDPYLFAEADRRVFGEECPTPTREDVVRAMLPYYAEWHGRGARLPLLVRGLHNLFAGLPGARAWRRALTEETRPRGADVSAIERALEAVLTRSPGA